MSIKSTIQKKEISRGFFPKLMISDSGHIILAIKLDGDYLEGITIHPESYMGDDMYSKRFVKSSFRIYDGTVTLKNI